MSAWSKQTNERGQDSWSKRNPDNSITFQFWDPSDPIAVKQHEEAMVEVNKKIDKLNV